MVKGKSATQTSDIVRQHAALFAAVSHTQVLLNTILGGFAILAAIVTVWSLAVAFRSKTKPAVRKVAYQVFRIAWLSFVVSAATTGPSPVPRWLAMTCRRISATEQTSVRPLWHV